MKIKRFTLLSLTALLITSVVFISYSEKKEHYFPRTNTYLSLKNQFLAGSQQFIADIKFNRSIDGLDPLEMAAAVKAANKMRKSSKTLDINWRFKGPDNVGGRTRSIIIDINDTTHILAGGVSGGIWESFDGAVSWQPYDSDFKISNVSAMAQGPDGTIYVGTGSNFDGSNNNKAKSSHFLGNGLFKLTGNGTSELLIGPNFNNTFGAEWSTVNNIAVNPNDADHILAATGTGLRESKDGGSTWTAPINSIAGACYDVEILGSNIVVTYSGTVLSSQDGGLNYTAVSFAGARRIEVAIAPSNSDIMFASATNFSNCLEGIYRSNDAGLNWVKINNTPDFFGAGRTVGACQGFYDNTITIHPTIPGKIFVGGVDMLQWNQSSVDPAPLEGGWRSIANTFDFPGNPFFIHADVHEFKFNPLNPNTLYIGTDGGISVCFNSDATFPVYSTSNFGFNVTQFYDIGVGPKDLVLGGTQDRGTQLVGLDFNSGKNGVQVRGGDGFDAQLFTVNPEVGIASLYFGNITRLQGLGSTLSSFNPDNANVYSGNLEQLCGGAQYCAPNVFYTSTSIWESFNHQGTTDSVQIQFEVDSFLPPIVQGTVLAYESKNNRWPLDGIVDFDLFPKDTLRGAIDRKAVRVNSNGINELIVNYDTIIVDTNRKEVVFRYRAFHLDTTSFRDTVAFNYNNTVNWTNIFETTTPLKITVRRDSIVFEDRQVTFFYEKEFADSVQTMVSLANVVGRGVSGSNQRNVWMTRDMLKASEVVRWFKIAGNNSTPSPMLNNDNVISNEFSADGDHLFLGTSNGRLYRVDNINAIDESMIPITAAEDFVVQNITSTRLIGSFTGRAVTGIAIDPNDANNIIVTLGNYGSNSYIRRSTNALAPAVTFEFIDGVGDGELPNTPIYDAIIDYRDNNQVLIATDLGVFGTENAFTTDTKFDSVLQINSIDVVWTEENAGLGRVPAMSIQQMRFPAKYGVVNQGKVYVGTHGRGIFETDKLVGINEIKSIESNKTKRNSIHIYPNPVRNVTNFDFEVNDISKPVSVQIYNIKGQLVLEDFPPNINLGKNSRKIDLSSLDNGTYIIRVISDNSVTSGKLIKN